MNGYVRVVNLRPGMGTNLDGDETLLAVDRTHPVLGNHDFPLLNKHDRAMRMKSIEGFRKKMEQDEQRQGPMYQAVLAIAKRVASGERIGLGCWCDPMPCHAQVVRDRVNAAVLESGPEVRVSATPEGIDEAAAHGVANACADHKPLVKR